MTTDYEYTVRQEVYRVLDGERDYQESLNGRALLVGEEILLMQEYINRAMYEWSIDFTDNPEIKAMDMIRKVAALGVRCMEHHGAQERG